MTQRVPLPNSFITAMQALLGERFTQSPAWLAQHGRDESPFEAAPPDAIAWPKDEAEVQAILRACDAHDVPVIARGAGTSLEGHLLAVHGGLSLDLSRMNAVLEISADNMLVRVQPGVTRRQLNEAVAGALASPEVEQAFAGYVYGDSTCGQRAVYEVGLTGIPVINVNNNCATGSTALFMARQFVQVSALPPRVRPPCDAACVGRRQRLRAGSRHGEDGDRQL